MLSIPTSLRPCACCAAAVLILPVVATLRGAAAQATPARPPLRSAVFPADTGRVRVSDVGVFRTLVDTVTANLSRLEIHRRDLRKDRKDLHEDQKEQQQKKDSTD